MFEMAPRKKVCPRRDPVLDWLVSHGAISSTRDGLIVDEAALMLAQPKGEALPEFVPSVAIPTTLRPSSSVSSFRFAPTVASPLTSRRARTCSWDHTFGQGRYRFQFNAGTFMFGASVTFVCSGFLLTYGDVIPGNGFIFTDPWALLQGSWHGRRTQGATYL